MQNVQTKCIILKKKTENKKTHTLEWVKIKSYATIPLSISFPWAWEKVPKVHLSDSIPSNPKDTLV